MDTQKFSLNVKETVFWRSLRLKTLKLTQEKNVSFSDQFEPEKGSGTIL